MGQNKVVNIRDVLISEGVPLYTVTTSGPLKRGGGLFTEVKSIVLALLGHNQMVFMERWPLDTGGCKTGFTVSSSEPLLLIFK